MPDFLSDLLTALEAYDSPIDSSALASTYGVTPTRLGDFVRDFVADSAQRVP
jgi:NADH dehydrogenase